MSARRSIDNRRRAYRVRPESVLELDLAILEKRYRVVRGKVTDVAIGGAQAHFASDALESTVEGERILLALASERYNFDRTLWARIVACENADNERTLSFSFEQDNEPLTPDSEYLFALFNRRAAYRHMETADGTAPAANVALRAPGGIARRAYPAAIHDISTSGVSIVMTPAAERKLAARDELTLSLTLPGEALPRHIPCLIRHRSRQGDTLCYGCTFDWPSDADRAVAAEPLVAYVRERLAEDARLAPDRRRQEI